MRYLNRILPVLAAVLLAGCGWEPIEPPGVPSAERVLLMYDNIGSWFEDDVKEAGAAVAAGALEANERVVVFHRNYRVDDATGRRSVIYELVKDASQPNGFRRHPLRVYEAGENADLSTEILATVVGDIRRAVPAEHYGFAFGSHGMAWIPKDSNVSYSRRGGAPVANHPFAEIWAKKENPMTRFFLSDWGEKLDVSEFIDGLDEWPWDFIILDDCFMASVESVYEMRDLTDYVIASPTEIMKYGFPYDRVVETVFSDWSEAGFVQVGMEFVNYYRNHSSRSGTIAVVKTSEMDDLAESVRRLNLKFNELNSATGIQYYERLVRPGHVFYDLDDYVGRIRATTMPGEYNAFRQQLSRAVMYADHTETFYSELAAVGYGTVIPINSFSGLSVFIPWTETTSFFSHYRQTAWYAAVYGVN